MVLYIPYGTDAPVYYRPIVTITMIVINIVLYASCTPTQIEPYRLAMGNGLHPIQWLTTNFLHGDIFHLVFNLLFLWVFGLVVEGKLGTFKMSAVYFGIAICYGAVVQTLTLGCEPGFRLGSSGVIFGLAAMSFIWASENKIYGFLLYWFVIRGGIKDLETDISLAVGFFAVLSVTWACFFGGGILGELGHIVGAVLGIITAIMMLKMNLVDCEYGDIFSVWTGAKERAEVEAARPEAVERREERKQERQKRQNLLIEEITLAMNNQTPLPAFIITQRMEREFIGWTLPQDLHLTLIRQLLAGKHFEEAVSAMRLYLERHQEQLLFVHLMLAQTLLSQNQPKSAMEVLDDIPSEELQPENQQTIAKIRTKAESMYQKNQEEDIYN